MSAPALVALSHGPRTPRSVATLADVVADVRAARPDLTVRGAHLCATRGDVSAVVDRLARAGHDEVVLVPVALGCSDAEHRDVQDAVAESGQRHRHLRVRAAEPLGLSPSFLSVLDERLRESLSRSRVRELDALVLAGPGSGDPLVNQSVARLARIWGSRHRLPTTAAYASSAPPSTGEAVRAFRAAGRRHIAVGSLFLTPGPLATRAEELAREAGALTVSRPLGAHPEVARAVLARYAVGAVELVPV